MSPRPAAFAAALLLGCVSCLSIASCGVVHAINRVEHDVQHNRTIIDEFNNGLKSGAAVPFEAVYKTTGANPATVEYAVRPPQDVLFTEHQSGGASSQVHIVVNAAGAYSCTPPSGSGQWSCQRIGTSKSISRDAIVDFYTPSHWVNFLTAFSLAAGFAGDKLSTSDITVNGFAMHCVDFVAHGIKGTSRICSTRQNILGYVKVAQDPTSFEITSFTTSPAAALFQLPAGAKITKAASG
jgi:hypothetical protein